MAVRTFVCPALCVFLALTAGAARAEPQNADVVAVLAVEVTIGVAQMADQVQKDLATGLEAQGIRLIRNEDVVKTLGAKPELADCAERACSRKIRKLVGAGRLVRLTVKEDSGLYNFTVDLVGQEGAGTGKDCPMCTTSELSKQVAAAAVELLSKHPTEPFPEIVKVEVHTTPDKAMVSIDGNNMGITPYRGDVKPGPHTITVTLGGYESAEKQVEVNDEEDVQRVDIELLAQVSASARPYRMLKWLGAGVTAASLTTGVVWLAVNGNGTCSGNGTCPEVYNTRGQGLASLGVGVIAGAATAWMFLRDSATGTHVTMVPTPGGAAGALTIEF